MLNLSRFMFLSKTEKMRHISAFHRHSSPPTAKSKPLIHSCTCGLGIHVRGKKATFTKRFCVQSTLTQTIVASATGSSHVEDKQQLNNSTKLSAHEESEEMSDKKVMSLRMKRVTDDDFVCPK